jgi:3',5'-cyclic AMP phosphodiesterase CpdA
MRVCLCGACHAWHCDRVQVLIHAGDFSNIGLPHDITALSEWLGGLPFRHKVVIAGTLPASSPGLVLTARTTRTARARTCSTTRVH